MQLSQSLLHYNEQQLELPAGKMSFYDELYVDYKIEKGKHFQRIQLSIHPKEDIVLHQLEIQFYQEFNASDSIFCNGFQSASESREYHFNEKIDHILPIVKSRFAPTGDTFFDNLSRGKGKLHSWTYSYLRQADQVLFIGSLNEQSGFSLIQFDQDKKQISIRKDCAGLELQHSFPILDIFIYTGKESAAFEAYFQLMESNKKTTRKHWTAWTTAQAYANTNIEAYILQNLKILTERKLAIDFIQIEDGYPSAIGDWLKIKSNFPNGMKSIATQIRAQGFRPAIWIAPFVCEASSDIFQQQKAWLLKDKKGQVVKAAYHPISKVPLYALDFYNEAFQKYLSGVFYTLLTKWGFDLLKMDFLYAVCLHPRKHKSSGQIMAEAMRFLQNLLGDKLSLAQAVPLGACFKQVDFCNLGGSKNYQWEVSLHKLLGYRERKASLSALRSLLSRWPLQGKAFLTSGAAISLDPKQNKLQLTQQASILTIQTLLGNLLSNEDNLVNYSEEQWTEFESIFKWKDSQVQSVEQLTASTYLIYFEQEGISYVAACNLAAKANSFSLKKLQIQLEAYETLILKRS